MNRATSERYEMKSPAKRGDTRSVLLHLKEEPVAECAKSGWQHEQDAFPEHIHRRIHFWLPMLFPNEVRNEYPQLQYADSEGGDATDETPKVLHFSPPCSLKGLTIL